MRSARQSELFVPLHPKASSVVHLLGHQEQICFQYICFTIKDNSHIQARNLFENAVFFWGGLAYIYIYECFQFMDAC